MTPTSQLSIPLCSVSISFSHYNIKKADDVSVIFFYQGDSELSFILTPVWEINFNISFILKIFYIFFDFLYWMEWLFIVYLRYF